MVDAIFNYKHRHNSHFVLNDISLDLGCVFSLLIIMRIYVLDFIIFNKSEIGFISHCVKSGHGTYCTVYYVLIKISRLCIYFACFGPVRF